MFAWQAGFNVLLCDGILRKSGRPLIGFALLNWPNGEVKILMHRHEIMVGTEFLISFLIGFYIKQNIR